MSKSSISTKDWILNNLDNFDNTKLKSIIENLLTKVESEDLDLLYAIEKIQNIDSYKMSLDEFLNYQKDIDIKNNNSSNKDYVIYKIEKVKDVNGLELYWYGIYDLERTDSFGRVSKAKWGWKFNVYFENGFLKYTRYDGTDWVGDYYTEFNTPSEFKETLDRHLRST